MATLEQVIASYLDNGAPDVQVGYQKVTGNIIVYAGTEDPVYEGSYHEGVFYVNPTPTGNVPDTTKPDDEYEASGWSKQYSDIGGRKSRQVEALRQRLIDDEGKLAAALASKDIIAENHILITNKHGVTSRTLRTQKIIDTVNDLPLTDKQKAGIIENLNRWQNIPSGGFEDGTPTPDVKNVSFARFQLTWRGQNVDVPANWGGWADAGSSLRPGMPALIPVVAKKLRPSNKDEYTLAYTSPALTNHNVWQPNVPGENDDWIAAYYAKFVSIILGYEV